MSAQRNEIKELRSHQGFYGEDGRRIRADFIAFKDNEIKELRSHHGEVLQAVKERHIERIDEKDNEIKQLKADNLELDQLEYDFRHENKGLRAMVTRGETLIAEKDKEIKDLRANAASNAVDAKSVLDYSREMSNENKDLEAIADTLFKKNKELQADALRAGDLANENKELRGYRAKAKVVKARLRNEIKDLQQELATSRDYSDRQSAVIRHYVNNNAELAKTATNLQHFRRFSND